MREIIAAQCRCSSARCGTAMTPSPSLRQRGERYKAELIRDLPATETITLYQQGDWIDLCRGPHMRGTGDVGPAFKLHESGRRLLAGRLPQRHAHPHLRYCLARCQKELDAYLHQLEEAERRDHRRIGPRDGPVPHPGGSHRQSIFWHPARLEAVPHRRERTCAAGWTRPATRRCARPQLVDRDAVGAQRALGQVSRTHVRSPRGGREAQPGA